MATTPSDVLNKMMSTPKLKGFIEVPIENYSGSSTSLISITAITRIEPYQDPNEDGDSPTKTYIGLVSRNAKGGPQVIIASMTYAEVKQLLIAAQ